MYVAVVVATIVVHFAFIAYVVVGGFVALRWRWTITWHAVAVAWGVLSTTLHFDCPLTWLERWGRAHAGMAPLPQEGFIAHYITGVLYPAGWADAVEVVAFLVVAVSWIVFGRRMRRRSAAARNLAGSRQLGQ